MKKKKESKIIEDFKDLALSILPELPALLTPEVIVNPGAVLAKIGTAIVTSKLQKFYSEFQEKKTKGELRDDLESARDSLHDLLKFINENPDEGKLDAVKKLFFRGVAPDTSEAEQQVTFALIEVCKKLTAQDLLVLKANYQIWKKIDVPETISLQGLDSRVRTQWFKNIALKLGHGLSSLVEASEAHLVTLKLITPIEERDPRLFFPAGEYRLTDLGCKLCDYLSVG